MSAHEARRARRIVVGVLARAPLVVVGVALALLPRSEPLQTSFFSSYLLEYCIVGCMSRYAPCLRREARWMPREQVGKVAFAPHGPLPSSLLAPAGSPLRSLCVICDQLARPAVLYEPGRPRSWRGGRSSTARSPSVRSLSLAAAGSPLGLLPLSLVDASSASLAQLCAASRSQLEQRRRWSLPLLVLRAAFLSRPWGTRRARPRRRRRSRRRRLPSLVSQTVCCR